MEDKFEKLLEKPTRFDGSVDDRVMTGRYYWSKEYGFAWKVVWDNFKKQSRIHVYKLRPIKVAGRVCYGWEESLVSSDHKTLRSMDLAYFSTPEEAKRKFKEMIS